MEPGRKHTYFFTHGRKGIKNAHLWWQVNGWKTIEARLIEKGVDEGIADIPEGYQLATLDQSVLNPLRFENLADFP